jgi:ketosteroid isomerase-like protein
VQSLYEAFGRGDMPTVLGAMAPDIRWHEAEGNPYMPSGEAWVGPDAIVANLFAKLGEEWNTGEYKDTGNRIDAQFCHVWSLADGKITKFQQYVDTGQLQEVMETKAG